MRNSPDPAIRRPSRSVKTAFPLLIALFQFCTSPLRAAELFLPAPALASVESAPLNRAETRGRLVTLNPAALNALAGNANGANLTLNLFPDATFTGEVFAPRPASGARTTAQIRFTDDPARQAVMVRGEGGFGALLTHPVDGRFVVLPAGGGTFRISQLDPLRMPGCGTTGEFMERARVKAEEKRRAAAASEVSEAGQSAELSPSASAGPQLADTGDETVVDLMVVYTAAARDGAGGTAAMETLIDLAVAEANLCFENSAIDVRINLVHRQEVVYNETGDMELDLDHLAFTADGQLEEIHSLRSLTYKADLVNLIVETETSGFIAGIAYVLEDPTKRSFFNLEAFSVVRRNYAVGDYVLVHELGHNFGCTHDRVNSSRPGAFPYSYGHRFSAQGSTFATVMTYPPGVRIPNFSNPDISHLGVPTGVDRNDPDNGTDNAATINFTGPNTVSTFTGADREFLFDSAGYDVTENAGTVNLTVRMNETASTTLTRSVRYVTEAGTAAAGQDFTESSGTLVFASGQTERTIQIAVLDDDSIEGPETFLVRLHTQAPSGSSRLSTPHVATVTINDDERSFRFSTNSYRFSENVGAASLTVLREGAADTPAEISAVVTPITASSNDLDAETQLVQFAAGQRTAELLVPVVNDDLPENEETFSVTLSNPTEGAAIQPKTVNVRIVDDDRQGAVDPVYNLAGRFNDVVYASGMQADGRMVFGGAFNLVDGERRAGIVRLNHDGTVDPTFDPGVGFSGEVLCLLVQPDGRIIAGGDFVAYNGQTVYNLARLNPDGSLDTAFNLNSGANDWVRHMALQPDGGILLGGLFTFVFGNYSPGVARLDGNGDFDPTFNVGDGTDNMVRAVAVQPDGKVLIGGDFLDFNGTPRTRLARLLENGALDPDFPATIAPDERVRAIVVDAQHITLAGEFETIAGVGRRRVARLTLDGELVGGFDTVNGPNDAVLAMVSGADGAVYVAGDFTAINAQSRVRVARLLSDGSPDPLFHPGSGANDSIWTLAVDPAGRLHLGGAFRLVENLPREHIAALVIAPELEPVPPQFALVERDDFSGDAVRLTFTAVRGATYVLEGSDDLEDWNDVASMRAETTTVELVDPSPPPTRRFYRIRWSAP